MPASSFMSASALSNKFRQLPSHVHSVFIDVSQLSGSHTSTVFDKISSNMFPQIHSSLYLRWVEPLIAYICIIHSVCLALL